MLLNPFRTTVQAIPGSRILQSELGLVGAVIYEEKAPERPWTIVGVYAPIKGRRLGGIRVKLQDDKGFVTFCNQRDLELFLGIAKPGNLCPWLGTDYPEFESDDFFGLCADEEDLRDDLYDRELELRAQNTGVLPYGHEVYRLIHLSRKNDHEELYMMLYDCDPETGYGPDPRLVTLPSRWTRIERNKLRWEALSL